MGIHNRDYFRDESPRGSTMQPPPGFRTGDSASKWILIACVVVFVLQNITSQGPAGRGGFNGGITNLFALHLEGLKDFQLWRILTYGLCHAPGLHHILFNMIGVWVFGRMTDSVYGPKETLAFFALAVGLSGLTEVGFAALGSVPVSVIGASGGVMGLVALAAMNFPKMPMYLMFIPVPIELRWLALAYIGFDVWGVLGGGGGNIANLAHLAGAATGVAYCMSGIRLTGGRRGGYGSRRSGTFGSLLKGLKPKSSPKPKANPNVRLYEPPADDLKREVDRILDKINREGKDSLSPEENDVLLKASESFRNRV